MPPSHDTAFAIPAQEISPGDPGVTVSPVHVFVHLAFGFDALRWQERWRRGRILGLNEEFPYGYHHARDMGCRVNFSSDAPENKFQHLCRGALRVLLGFDILHAWRNRHAICQADIIWTHTESQYLAVAALFKTLPKDRRPKIIGQSVWLIDRWVQLGPVRKAFYGWLIEEVDVLTFHSPLNAERAAGLFPRKRCEIIQFGLSTEVKSPVAASEAGGPIKILAIGNDRHRDWDSFLAAFGGKAEFVARIATQKLTSARIAKYPNVELCRPRDNDELMGIYRWADIVVVPLSENLHASGITVLQEAALMGRPAICSQTGGLEAYFKPDEVLFVKPGDPRALHDTALRLGRDPNLKLNLAQKAQARMCDDDLSSRSFVRDHVTLSRILLSSPGHPASAIKDFGALKTGTKG